MGKLINRIPGSRLLILSLPGLALRTHVDIARQASRCQHAFSKPCLVNLISKDTHLVFSIYTFDGHTVFALICAPDSDLPLLTLFFLHCFSEYGP